VDLCEAAPVSQDPQRIIVQLSAARTRNDVPDPEVVRRHVALVLRRAYPKVDVMVLWQKDAADPRVHVVGDDPNVRHTDTVRRLVDFVVARAARIPAFVA
jgi:hypothetical protein